jgi:hypothetical protein
VAVVVAVWAGVELMFVRQVPLLAALLLEQIQVVLLVVGEMQGELQAQKQVVMLAVQVQLRLTLQVRHLVYFLVTGPRRFLTVELILPAKGLHIHIPLIPNRFALRFRTQTDNLNQKQRGYPTGPELDCPLALVVPGRVHKRKHLEFAPLRCYFAPVVLLHCQR